MPDDDIHIRYLALLRDFRGNILAFCASYSNDQHDAEELLQEVYVQMWEGLPGLRADSGPRQKNRWMQRVMRTALFRHLRRAPRLHTVPLTHDMQFADPGNHAAELLDELLEHLSPDEARLVDERRQGYTLAEIARRNGLTLDAVKQRFHRIIEKLRKYV